MNTLILASSSQWGAAPDGKGFYIFGFEIYYYALCIVSAMIMAAVFSALLMKRRNMAPDFIFTLFVVCIPVAIVGARLFYCITKPLPITQWLDVRDGGLSIIGGASSGVLAGFIVCIVKKVNFLRAADCVIPTLFLAHMFGRWGNFFNGEIYGAEVASDSMKWFPFAVPIAPGKSGIQAFSAPNAVWHYAFFFYEGMICLIVFCLLFWAAWKWNKKPNGIFIVSYPIIYGVMRTIMEPLRDARDILSGDSGIPWSMVMSILYIVFGVIGAALLLYFNYRKEGALFGSKKGDPCGIREYLSPDKKEQPYFSKINMFGSTYPPKPPKEEREKQSFKEWCVGLREKFVKLGNKLVNLFKKKTEADEETAQEPEAGEGSAQEGTEPEGVAEAPAEETGDTAEQTEREGEGSSEQDAEQAE